MDLLQYWKALQTIALLTLALAVFSFTSQIIYNLFFSPLRRFPGPRLWAISSLPRIIFRAQGNDVSTRAKAHAKYGKVVRVSPNELSWIDEGVFKDVWAHRQGHEEFAKIGQLKTPEGYVGILQADREDHARFRRLLSHAFSEKEMRNQQPHISEYVDMLIEGLEGRVGKGAVDMVQWFNWTSFDVIGKLAFGQDFGCLRETREHPWIKQIFGSVKSLTFIMGMRDLGLGWLLPYMASSKMLEARKENFHYVTEMIKARVSKTEEQHDFWDNVLKQSAKNSGMRIEEMNANASHLVLAGSETTATLLSGCIYQLTKNPSALAKITQEIRSSFTSLQEIDMSSTSKLTYTLAVLNETMRIYSPVPAQFGRRVPPGGDTVLGHFLPGGTVIHFAQQIAHHYPEYWTEPEEFHPERFLGDERFKNDNFEVMQPFSVGPRNCIGRNLAYAEMRMILARFIWRFDVKLDEKMRGVKWDDQKVFVLWEKHPLWVNLTPVSKD